MVHEIRPGVAAWVSGDRGWGASNAVLIGGARSSMLVDTQWDLPRTAAMLAAFAPRLANAPITQTVNTHADGDHWFGNQLVQARKRFATPRALETMRRRGPGEMRALTRAVRLFSSLGALPLPLCREWGIAGRYLADMVRPLDFSGIRPTLPNAVFTDHQTVDVSGRAVELVELGPAHTSGDLAVLLRDERLLLAGDMVFAGIMPVLWDGSLRNWIRGCEWMLNQKVDTVVPGHGPLGDLTAVEDMRRYWQFLWHAGRQQYEKTRTPAAAARWIAIDPAFHAEPFARWEGTERLVINLHAIYRRLMRRRRNTGVWEKLLALKEAALFADELERAGGIERLRPESHW
jgi:cyclase